MNTVCFIMINKFDRRTNKIISGDLDVSVR